MKSTHQILGIEVKFWEAIAPIFNAYPEVEKWVVFGSRATGKAQEGSDIDIALFAPRLSFERYTEIWNALDNLSFIYRIDLVHFESLKNEKLKAKILKEGIELAQDIFSNP